VIGEEFNEPGGLLFGEPPLAAGQRRKWEEWEYIWYPTMASAALILTFGLTSRPDSGVMAWALEEAREKEARAIASMQARDRAAAVEQASLGSHPSS